MRTAGQGTVCSTIILVKLALYGILGGRHTIRGPALNGTNMKGLAVYARRRESNQRSGS